MTAFIRRAARILDAPAVHYAEAITFWLTLGIIAAALALDFLYNLGLATAILTAAVSVMPARSALNIVRSFSPAPEAKRAFPLFSILNVIVAAIIIAALNHAGNPWPEAGTYFAILGAGPLLVTYWLGVSHRRKKSVATDP